VRAYDDRPNRGSGGLPKEQYTMPDKRLLLLPFSILLPLTCAGQVGLPADKAWSADMTLYMLGAGMSGNATVHGVTTDVNVPFSDIWRNLQFGVMGRPTVHYRHWAISTDVIYMGLGAAKNGYDLGFDQWLVEPVVQYQVTPWLSPYAGARYISLKGDLRGPQGRTGTGVQSWWDPVVGADVHLPIKGKIGLVVHGDVGGFGAGSSFSGQIEPMLDWRVGKKVSLQFGYAGCMPTTRQVRAPAFSATTC
jgi:hypothetical protein